jgi:hypothetical protein
MEENCPSRTAQHVAMLRAAHQILDDPKIFHNPLALRLLGLKEKSAQDPNQNWLKETQLCACSVRLWPNDHISSKKLPISAFKAEHLNKRPTTRYCSRLFHVEIHFINRYDKSITGKKQQQRYLIPGTLPRDRCWGGERARRV